MSGFTTEFDEEAESAIENAPKALKQDLFGFFCFSLFSVFLFFSSPHRFIPPSVPFRATAGGPHENQIPTTTEARGPGEALDMPI